MSQEKVLITGAGGFIGHHLARFLRKKGYWVRGVDIKYPEFSGLDDFDEFRLLDMRSFRNALEAAHGVDKVYALAANMGGIGFITSVHADIMRDNGLINGNMAEAVRLSGVKKILFSSSICVYPTFKLDVVKAEPLKEERAYPAFPNESYGWEKLYSERVYQSYKKDYGLDIRIARYENTYGPEGTYDGGREKAPAAICRKIALAKNGGSIEVWGDGKQTRTFLYVEDNIRATYRLMESDYDKPMNIGNSRLISVNELVAIVAKIANKDIKMRHDLGKPQGVRGRIVDIERAKTLLGWSPKVSVEQGMEKTYDWIKKELKKQGRI